MTDSANNARQQQLKTWLQHTFDNQPYSLDSLPGDASARRYHRIQLLQNDTITARYIVMDSADEQDAMQQFITVAKLMAPAVNVPTLIAQDLDKGFLVLQDFGAVEFAHLLVGATPEQVNLYYQSAMQSLIDLQKIPVDTAKHEYKLPDYDAAMLDREMDLFSEWFIPYIDVQLDATLWHNVKTALIEAILMQPQVIVHRDYHSRNLMQDQSDVMLDKAGLGVIDFQDAVIGAYSYDLVSLVRDAYVDWAETQISSWIHDFWQLQQQAGLSVAASVEQFERDVNVMGVQRHLKVLGIFIRLSQRDGKDRYLADIPKVMRDLLFELEWLGTHGDNAIKQVILSFSTWMIETVLPAYQSSFSQQYI
ncbi:MULTISPECIES: aminoglycoside phosphotransferase family protein [unclassified Psychrobacter]|uniref:aminoglycoside phosphotransferase family protein n=2 Tax=Psychrobacter TaxID=497 RepID=UPI003FD5E285